MPEEDAVPGDSPSCSGPRVVVVAAPHASNLDEFERLRAAGAHLSFARDAAAIAASDYLILPGSKQVRADLDWLKDHGIDGLLRSHIAARRPLLAICGGLQMLGELIEDPSGLEGAKAGCSAGLGLLPLATRIRERKHLARVRTRFAALEEPWTALSGLEVEGYEIHLGETRACGSADDSLRPVLAARSAQHAIGWQRGPILAVYLHGLLENAAVLEVLTGRAVEGVGFDAMADHVERGFTPGFLESLVHA